MGIVARRIWRAVGVQGLLCTVAIVFAVYGLVRDPASVTTNTSGTVVLIGIGVVGVARLVSRLRGYQSGASSSLMYRQSRGLLTSTEEFCLVLRPFGADGEVLPGRVAVCTSCGPGASGRR
jgi:hypothetical protein